MFLKNERKEIMIHTMERAAGNRFCGDSPDMQFLVENDLMKPVGSFLGNPYFTLTENGIGYYKEFLKNR